MRTGDVESGLSLGRRIRGDGYPSAIELLYSSQTLFNRAVAVQETYADHGLSFTDAVSVAMIEYHDIDGILSFDDDFDGVVNRLAPETVVSG